MFEGHLTPGGFSDLDFIMMLLALAVELTDQCQPHHFAFDLTCCLSVLIRFSFKLLHYTKACRLL